MSRLLHERSTSDVFGLKSHSRFLLIRLSDRPLGLSSETADGAWRFVERKVGWYKSPLVLRRVEQRSSPSGI